MEMPFDKEATVGRAEFTEFQKRLEDQKSRWDKRLEALETKSEEQHKLTTSVEKLAQSMETMAEEQKRQGQRLDKIESRDGEMWRKLIGYVLTALTSAVMTFIFTRLGR